MASTTNYGWVKPDIGASDDAWGGYINADLDGIDSVVHGIQVSVPAPYVLPTASTSVLGGVKVDGSTITIAGGVISGTPPSNPPVTVSDTAPSSPAVGTLWWDSVGGQLYTWYNDGNTSQWVIAVNAAASLLPASTTVLGGVKVDGTTIQATADGTISTTVVPMGDNRVINGDMRIDQRNAGASGSAINAYTVDRWTYGASQAGKGNWVRANAGIAGFPYCLAFTSATAYASVTSDYFFFTQPIEADMISDFQWGTASAQPVTLSLWAASTLTGTFSGAIRNGTTPQRSYPFTFSLPTASTWTRIVITIPGDTTGTWPLSGNGVGLYVRFDLGTGATYRGPANAWANGDYFGATGAVSVVSTNAATFYVTGVKLEIGSVATPFNRQSLAKIMADCQRYYQALYTTIGGYGVTSTPIYGGYSFPVTMRAAPTVVYVTPAYSNASAWLQRLGC